MGDKVYGWSKVRVLGKAGELKLWLQGKKFHRNRLLSVTQWTESEDQDSHRVLLKLRRITDIQKVNKAGEGVTLVFTAQIHYIVEWLTKDEFFSFQLNEEVEVTYYPPFGQGAGLTLREIKSKR
jgi:hypothetical protein